MSLTFGEQLKIVLKQRNMSVKELASEIEKFTGKPMSRQNLNQKLGRNNFQEKDMRMIAEILDLTFTLDILGGEVEKLPVEKVIEGNMTVAEVLNLKDEEAKEDSKTDSEQAATEEIAVVEEAAIVQEDDATVEECVMESSENTVEVEIATGFAEAIEDKTNRVMQDVDSVNFMKKKGSFEEPPINMQNYRSKKDLFIDLDVQKEVDDETPQKTSEELIAELLREMEEIERDKATQIEEARERQEKWESRRKENTIVSKIGKWFKSAIKNRNAEEKIEQQPDEEYLNETLLLEDHSSDSAEEAEVENRSSEQTEEIVMESDHSEQMEETVIEDDCPKQMEEDVTEADDLKQTEEASENDNLEQVEEVTPENSNSEQEEEQAQNVDLNTEIENLKEMIPAEELVSNANDDIVFAPAKEEILGEINPYTGLEYETNSVRNHKERIGYVQVYSREIHGWKDMTEWAFLGYQEKKRVEQGENYVPPIYLD